MKYHSLSRGQCMHSFGDVIIWSCMQMRCTRKTRTAAATGCICMLVAYHYYLSCAMLIRTSVDLPSTASATAYTDVLQSTIQVEWVMHNSS